MCTPSQLAQPRQHLSDEALDRLELPIAAHAEYDEVDPRATLSDLRARQGVAARKNQ